MNNLNTSCNYRIKELEVEEKREKVEAERWNLIKARRNRVGNERTMAFGNLKNILEDKKIKKQPTTLKWNPYVEKAARGGSINITPQNRSSPFKPMMADVAATV
jgi:hypothetical protein